MSHLPSSSASSVSRLSTHPTAYDALPSSAVARKPLLGGEESNTVNTSHLPSSPASSTSRLSTNATTYGALPSSSVARTPLLRSEEGRNEGPKWGVGWQTPFTMGLTYVLGMYILLASPNVG